MILRPALLMLLLLLSGVARADDLKLSADEKNVLDLTNEARKKEKLEPVTANKVLCEVARAHSANMAKQGQMKHELDNKTPAKRVLDAGYDYSFVGENIAAGERWKVKEVFQAWMDSEHHRKNILKPDYREIGIGIAKGENGQVYYTQVFGTQKMKHP